MAKLHNIMEELAHTPSKGKKRRAWLESEFKDQGESKPGLSTRSINRVDQPGLSTRSINPVDQSGLKTGAINPVDQLDSDKGAINPVDQPGFFNLDNLRGNPLKILMHFYELSQLSTEKNTGNVVTSQLSQHLDITKESVRTAIKFLLKTGILERVIFKSGQKGWAKYKINENSFNQLENIKTKWFIDHKRNTVLNTRPIGSNSSSSYINNTTTTKDKPEINISKLANHGFSDEDIPQLLKKCDGNESRAQASIDHFVFELTNKKNIEKPKAWFFKIINENKYYPAPDGYKSPEQIYEEEKLKQLKEAKKLREERENLEFEEWVSDLTENEKKALVSETTLKMGLKKAIEAELKAEWKNIKLNSRNS